jgi:hypothetical protein
VLALFILGGLASHLLFRKYPMGRAVVRVVVLILLTVAFAYAGIVPYHPTRLTGNTLYDAVHGVLKIAWWLWAAWFLGCARPRLAGGASSDGKARLGDRAEQRYRQGEDRQR